MMNLDRKTRERPGGLGFRCYPWLSRKEFRLEADDRDVPRSDVHDYKPASPVMV